MKKKKIWKPVIISEWFPTPDHHDDHHHHYEEHGWDRKDNTKTDKVVWKRDDSTVANSGGGGGSAQKSTQLQPVQTTEFQNKPTDNVQKETSKAFKFPAA